MTDRYKSIIDNFVRWGIASNKLHAALVLGSQARKNLVADEYSDLDIVMIVDEPDYFMFTDQWLHEIGLFHISFIEDTLDGLKERRVMFDNALDVDFILRPKDTIKAIPTEEIALLFSRGYSFLIDKIELENELKSLSVTPQEYHPMAERDFINIVNDFWYHSVWTAKKLKRGELWTAKFCIDSYMKWKLLTIIECHARMKHGEGYDTWYNGRFLEHWAESWIVDKLSSCFAQYNRDSIQTSLLSTIALFRLIAIEVSEKLYFQYPKCVDEYASGVVSKMFQEN